MKKLTIILFITAFIAGGCGKKFLDINQNPNQPTQVGLTVILSGALQGSVNDLALDFPNVTRWDAYWSRSGNYVPDVQTEAYSIPNNYTDGEWTRIYLTLNAYHNMEMQGKGQKLSFYIAVAKLMKAFHFSILVDVFNNVPYTNAFDPLNSVHPTYDKGADIYADLFKQIDSAIVDFDLAKNTVTTQDQAFDGVYGKLSASDEMDAWIRFANTMELKLLIHESQISGQASFIASQIAKIVANGRGFIGAGQGAAVNPGYSNSTNKISPFYGVFYLVTAPTTNVAYYRANTYAVNFYNNAHDPRVGYFFGPVPNTTSTYAGNFDGDPAAVPNTNTSPIGPGVLKGPTQYMWLLSDFESLFLQAEAAQRGWIAGSAQTFYESAITQSFVYLYQNADNSISGTPAADAATYYTQGIANVDWAASTDKLTAILTQKWAALDGINWEEAWTDFRRTGIPALPISASNTHVVPKIPIRFLYPQVELNTNGSNVPPLPANAQFTSAIFWNQ
ncbi:MAG TPA: SusD/RagB family nutrient-binding outer membrane lipoprotein [Puia sp.]